MNESVSFSECLSEAIKSHRVTQAAYARAIKRSPALVSNWINGELPTADQLPPAIAVFDSETKRLLLRLWIREVFGPEWLTLLEINREKSEKESADSFDTLAQELPAKVRTALRVLMEISRSSSDAREHLISTARVLRPDAFKDAK